MFTSIKEVEEFDKFVEELKTKKKNNAKDIDNLVNALNGVGGITFCNLALNKNKIIALVKNKENVYEPFTFKVDYEKDNYIKVSACGKDLGFKNKKSFEDELRTTIYVIHTIKDLKIYNQKLGLPDYYYHMNNGKKNKKPAIQFGWDLESKKEKALRK